MKRFGRKLLALTLSAALMAGLSLPVGAAYTTYGPVTNPAIGYDETGRQLSFVDIDNGAVKDRVDVTDQTALYTKALTSNSTFRDWASIAYNIFECDRNTYWDHAGKGWNQSYGEGHYIDFIHDMEVPTNEDGVISTGISVTSSLKEVQRQAAEDIAEIIDRKLDADDFLDRHKLPILEEFTSSSPVLYSTVTTVDRYGVSPQYGYDSFILAFYDFQLRVIANEDELSGVENANETNPNKDKELVVLNTNNGFLDSQVSSTLANTVTETLSTSLSTTDSTTYGQAIGGSAQATAKIPFIGDTSFTITGDLTFQEATAVTEGQETSLSESVNRSVTVTSTLPAHTVDTATQTIGTSYISTSYDCPVAISYKVVIISMNGTCYDDNAWVQEFNTSGYEQYTFITAFGEGGRDRDGKVVTMGDADAVEALYQRATKHRGDLSYDRTYGYTRVTEHDGDLLSDCLDWDAIIAKGAPSSESIKSGLKGGTTLIYALDDTYPMSVSGGTTSISATSISSVQNNPMPILPIASTFISWQVNRSFQLEVGESMDFNTYRVHAWDKDAVDYYGFVASTGQWCIVDRTGNKVETDIAEMEYDPVTKEQLLVTKAPGTVYVKYFIPENFYYTYDGTVSTNADISSPAYKVEISDPAAEDVPFEGTIELTGSVAVTTGETVNLNAEESLTLTCLDPTGKEVEPDVSWESKELASKGIEVSPDGALTVTQPGTYHVRAYQDAVYSDWVEVTASEPQELTLYIQKHIFQDVPYHSWYESAVEFVFQNGLMNGTQKNTFDPNGEVSRAMVAQILYRMAGDYTLADSPFADVPNTAWYANAVTWAAEKGLATGDESGFRPEDPVSREELAAFLCRYADAAGLTLDTNGGALSDFADAGTVSGWAKSAMDRAVAADIFNGSTDGKLHPQGTLLRCELAQTLLNLLEK